MNIMAAPPTLGGPLLRTTHAQAHLPEQWRTDLLHALSAPDRSRLALTSSTALGWLLADWPQATLTVPVKAAAEHPAALLRRLQLAKRGLAQRGDKDTTLLLQQQGSIPQYEAWWVAYLAQLSPDEPVPTLALQLSLQRATSQLLSYVGVAFQGLQSLTLGPHTDGESSNVELPPPTALRTLRHLTLGYSDDSVWPTVAPYLPQLITLSVQQQQSEPHVWAAVFKAQYRSQTLRRLTVPQCRPKWLATVLEACAPAVQELTLGGIRPGFGLVDSATCPWDKLRVGCHLSSVDFPGLPVPLFGPLEVTVGADGLLSFQLPLSEQEYQHLRRLRFTDITHVSFSVAAESAGRVSGCPPHDQPLLISHILSYVQPTQTSARLQLYGLTMTPDLAACIAAAHTAGWKDISLHDVKWPATTPAFHTTLPPLQDMELCETLTDKRLCRLLWRFPAVDQLSVHELSLEMPLREGTKVPWRTLHVQHADLATLARHASLLGTNASFSAGTVDVCLNSHEVDGGGYEFLSQQLSRLRLSEVGTVYVRAAKGLCAADEARVLRASLMLIQRLPCTEVHVLGWTASEANIQQLRFLPPWQSVTLPLRDGSVPFPTVLSQAPSVIPESYNHITLKACGLSMWTALLFR